MNPTMSHHVLMDRTLEVLPLQYALLVFYLIKYLKIELNLSFPLHPTLPMPNTSFQSHGHLFFNYYYHMYTYMRVCVCVCDVFA